MKRAKLEGMRTYNRKFNQGVKNALKSRGSVSKYVRAYLQTLLESNQQPDGSPRPSSYPVGKKYPKTIQAYKRRGLNTETYLVATGKSAKLHAKTQNSGMTLVVFPANPKILSYHIPTNKWRGDMEWMQLNRSTRENIVSLVGRDVKKQVG